MTLLKIIESYPSEKVLWITDRGRSVRVSDLSTQFSLHAGLFQKCRDRNVAVLFRQAVHLMAALTFLDGVARQIFFVPGSEPRDAVRRLLIESKSEILLTDESPDGLNDWENLHFQIDWEEGRKADAGARQDSSETVWLLATSGTTGFPKLAGHTLESLTRTHQRNIEKGQTFTWGLLYDPARFAGLQVFLQAVLSLSRLVITDDTRPLNERLQTFADHRCNALSATPTLWRKILMCPAAERLNLRQITLGGEIVDRQIIDALVRKFPSARVVHIFASTEAGVGFAVDDQKEGFPAAWLNDPPPGIQIKVDPEGFLLIKPSGVGSLRMKEGDQLRDQEGFINTGDLVRREGDRYQFLGRANGAINVGGNKVFPEEVENVMLGFKGVKFVAVKSKKSPIVGYLVAADVVMEDRSMAKKDFIEGLQSFCRSRLEEYKVPAFINIVEEIHTSQTGKMIR